jgi:hypothetical protein
MTLHEIEWLVVVGGVVLAAAATRFDVSPWRIFGLAGIATVATVVLALHVSGEACGVWGRTGLADRVFDITIVSSLTLYAAAALAGIADGIRLGRAGDRDTAISRAVGIPMVSGMGVVILFFAFMGAIGHCLG